MQRSRRSRLAEYRLASVLGGFDSAWTVVTTMVLLLGTANPVSATITTTGNVTPDPNTTTSNTDLYVGQTENGSMLVDYSTVMSRNSYIGHDPGAVGVATLTSAFFGTSTWANSGSLYVGYNGTGSLEIERRGQVSNLDAYIGYNAFSMGTVTVDGQSSTWTNNGNLYVGNFGNGELEITNGGEVKGPTTFPPRSLYIGHRLGSAGEVTVTGILSGIRNFGSINVGNAGIGTLNITNRGSVTSDYGRVGSNVNSTSTVNVDGVGSYWFLGSGSLCVGCAGLGELNITNGGQVRFSTSTSIGSTTSSVGTVTVDGLDSILESIDLSIGNFGIGTLNITGGGIVDVWDAVDFGRGTINLTDGTLRLAGGDIRKLLGGGATTFNFAGGRLEGAGTIALGSTFVQDGGTLAPGNSIGTTEINGAYRLNTGVLELELNGHGTAGVDWDLLEAGGLNLLGSNGLADGVVDIVLGFAPAVGDEFLIIENYGSLAVTGTFANGSLVRSDYQGRQYEFAINYIAGDGNDVSLTTQSISLLGDFDADGDVDGRDFLAWQRNPGIGNLADWQANYGIGPLSEVAAVPEPTGAILLIIGVSLSLLIDRRGLDHRTEGFEIARPRLRSQARHQLISLRSYGFYGLMWIIASGLMTIGSDARAQAFPNDNDGLLDVGESPSFPANPGAATGTLYLSAEGIQDLDATSLLVNLQRLDLGFNEIVSIEMGDFTGLANLQTLELDYNDIATIQAGAFTGLTNLQTLDLSRQGSYSTPTLTGIAAGTFTGLGSLRTLELDSNHIGTIEAGAFTGLANLQTLSLSDQGSFSTPTLIVIPAGAFTGLNSLQSLDLSSNEITSIASSDFTGLTNLQTLDLDYNAITNVHANTFSALTNLRSLGFGSNELVTIESGAFQGLSNVTGMLDLSSQQLTTLVSGAFTGLSNLQTLDLSDQGSYPAPGLTNISAGTFLGLTSLHTLDLRSNDMTILESGSFTGLDSLQTLDLSFNALTTIRSQAFSGLTSLQTLQLGYNDIATIESGAFQGLTNVTGTLDLSSQQVTTLVNGAFAGLTNLQSLDLNSNNITTIEVGAFTGLINLQTLDLSYQGSYSTPTLITIPAGAFVGLSSLQTLRLDSNNITTIESSVLNGLSVLTTLDLSSNAVTSIESGDLAGLTSLQTLDLSSQGTTSNRTLAAVRSGTFSGLLNLQSLDLSSNAIGDIETGLFTGLTNLRSLDLNDNRIVNVQSNDFAGLTNLQNLDLGSNDITSIETGAFAGLINLNTLTLNYNNLTEIAPDQFTGLSNVQTLNLSFNDIANIDSGDYSELDDLRTLHLSGNNISHLDGGDFTGMFNLQTLNLGGNGITNVDSASFTGLTNLRSLDLTSNAISNIDPGDFNGLDDLQTLNLRSNDITMIQSGAFTGLTNLLTLDLGSNDLRDVAADAFTALDDLQTLLLNGNDIASIPAGAFAGLRNLTTLDLRTNDLNELNLARAEFVALINSPSAGLFIDGSEITSLVLDSAKLSQLSFAEIVTSTTSLLDASLVGLKFSNGPPSNLTLLLGISSLNNVRVDQSLFNSYASALNAFDALPGNTVTIVETSLPGDFDFDGDVDGRDFLVWQRNPTIGSLNDWQANYGARSLSASTAVPEPSTFLMLLGLAFWRLHHPGRFTCQRDSLHNGIRNLSISAVFGTNLS